VVWFWNEVANRTVSAASTTDSAVDEQRRSYHADLATMHGAIDDAVSAIDGRFKPFAVTPVAPAAGASTDAAAAAAAYGVLRALFPNRRTQYQAAHDGSVAALPADVAEAARLMAHLYLVHADAIGACVEAKYHDQARRPLRAIPLADTDGNAATASDAAWTPVLPTPNHPE